MISGKEKKKRIKRRKALTSGVLGSSCCGFGEAKL